ncbi:MAG: hypothetical protein DMF57_06220 [Acidobacteria bacterium]|nr:MAG: hypothetical protein DMF57_06220 [Acidobacteriota bacterium]
MPEHHAEDHLLNPETHHERSDVNVRALLWFLVIFIVFGVFTHFFLWILFKHFAKEARRDVRPPLTAMQRPGDLSVPQGPRLQPFPAQERPGQVMAPYRSTPVTDMEEMQRSEDQALHNPGWVDRQKGIVRLPIDVAKQLALQRGFPVVRQ